MFAEKGVMRQQKAGVFLVGKKSTEKQTTLKTDEINIICMEAVGRIKNVICIQMIAAFYR